MVTDAQLLILRLIGRMYFLTAEQVRARYYGRSLTLVQSRLKGMVDAGYLVRRGFRPALQGGSYPYVYSPSSKGRKILVDLGDLPRQRFRPAEDAKIRQYPSHTLAVNDVLIACERLCGAVELTRFIHERTIARTSIPYKADSYLEFTNDRGYLLEVDLGTEVERFWRTKIERLCRFVDSTHYDDYFDLFHGVIVVAPAADRASQLKRWTEDELTKLGLAHWGELFTFTTMDIASDPERLPTIL